MNRHLLCNGCTRATVSPYSRKSASQAAENRPATDLIFIFLVHHQVRCSLATRGRSYFSSEVFEKSPALVHHQDDGGGERLDTIYERLEAMDAATGEKRAAEILFSLGFDKEMQAKKRMRIALATSLFIMPTILLLDEPTNHLDLEACVWLEKSLKNFDRILVVVSHSQDFLNGVCSNIIHMLKYYTGNFNQYCQTRSELEEKQYKWEQEQISHMKEYIAGFCHGSAKLARQAQSKEKTLAKVERGGLTEKVARDSVLVFRFADVGKDFGVDLDSRVALVGPNGTGKSTLLKLTAGELQPTEGMVRRHNHLKIAQYHQQLAEKLDLEVPALIYMMNEFPGNEEEKMRAAIGRFGLTGKAQVMPMKNLSGGQRSRVIFAWLGAKEAEEPNAFTHLLNLWRVNHCEGLLLVRDSHPVDAALTACRNESYSTYLHSMNRHLLCNGCTRATVSPYSRKSASQADYFESHFIGYAFMLTVGIESVDIIQVPELVFGSYTPSVSWTLHSGEELPHAFTHLLKLWRVNNRDLHLVRDSHTVDAALTAWCYGRLSPPCLKDLTVVLQGSLATRVAKSPCIRL